MSAWQRKRRLGAERLTPEQALDKAERYCAYQDRCHQEVRRKLFDLGLYAADVDQVMAKLIEDRFVDEERFARSFARGKFRMKAWGRLRIERELKQRDVSAYCIRAGLSEIEEEDYRKTLEDVLRKRHAKQDATKSDFERRGDLLNYAFKRGFESELAREVVKGLIA